MDWNELKDKIYLHDGALRDIYILDFSVKEWEKWINYADKTYKIQWVNTLGDEESRKTNSNSALELLKEGGGAGIIAKIFINKLQINAHFFSDETFESDIDPNEFNSLDDHNMLLKYIINLSVLFDKEVLLTCEMHPEHVLMRVFNDTVTYY